MHQETEERKFLKRSTSLESQIHKQVKEIWTEKVSLLLSQLLVFIVTSTNVWNIYPINSAKFNNINSI